MPPEILALLITIGVEYAVYRLYLRSKERSVLLNAILINALTQPLANFAMRQWFSFSGQAWLRGFLIVETLVVLSEAPLIRSLFRLEWKRAFALSLLANAVTAALSFLF